MSQGTGRGGGVFRRSLVVGFLLAALPGSALAQSADVERSIDWLVAEQSLGGAWGTSAVAVRDSSEAILALAESGRGDDAAVQSARTFLLVEQPGEVDLALRRIAALDPDDPITEIERAALASARSSEDQGWPFADGFAFGAAVESSLAGIALRREVLTDRVLYQAWFRSLMSHQSAAGSLDPYDGDGDAELTALAVLAIVPFDGFGAEVNLDLATEWLVTHQGADGSFGGTAATATVLRALTALAETGRDTGAAVTAARQFLAATQLPDGSWDDSAFATSAAIRALRLAGPNLTFASSDVVLSDRSPLEGDVVAIDITVRNTGLQDAPASFLRVTRGAEAVSGDLVVPALPAGSSTGLHVDWDTTGHLGDQVLTVTVDETGAVAEADETDNAREYLVRVMRPAEPDLVVFTPDFFFEPPRAVVDEPVDLHARVRNTGDFAVGAVSVRFYDGDPLAGSPLLGEVVLAGVGSVSTADATLVGAMLPAGRHLIYVVVDEPGAIEEADETNNRAARSLVVAEDVNLSIDAREIALSHESPVSEGTVVTVTASIRNLGTVASAATTVRFWDGAPESGGTALGAAQPLPGLDGGESEAFSIDFDTSGLPGFHDLVVVVDPDGQVDESDERDNRALRGLEVTARADLTVSARAFSVSTVREGQDVTILVRPCNEGIDDLHDVRVRVFDGDPALGNTLRTDLPIALLQAGARGIPACQSFGMVVPTRGLSAGQHTLTFRVDPDDGVVESDESNNDGTMSLTIEAIPDLAVELSVDTAEPPEGAAVNATLRVRNVELAAAVSTKRFRVRLVREAAAGDDAEVLVDQLVSGAGAGFDRTFAATWDTAGHVGPRTLRAEVDPERVLGEHVVDNNTATAAVTVVPADRPDLAVTAAGITIDPADTAVGSTATVRATISNRTGIAAADVMVQVFSGDPDSGGTPIGDPQTIVDLPGRATADVSVAWDTTGLSAGAKPVFVRVDGLATIDETNEENNQAARGFELRLDDAARPTDLAALVTGHDVQLSWTAPATPVAGYEVVRDGRMIVTGETAADFPATVTASSNQIQAGRAYDRSPFTRWEATVGDLAPQITLVWPDAQMLTSVAVDFWTAQVEPQRVRFETWDGAAFVTAATVTSVLGGGRSVATLTLPAPVRSTRLRVTVLDAAGGGLATSIVEIAPKVASLVVPASLVDAARPAGTYEYAVRAVDSTGLASRLSDPETATVELPVAPTDLTATVDGTTVQLAWTLPADPDRQGTYVLRDGVAVTADVNISADATVQVSAGSVPANPGTAWSPPSGGTGPWTWTLVLPRKRHVSRLDLTWFSNEAPRAFQIETCAGDVCTVERTETAFPHLFRTNPATVSFRFPGKALADRVRVVATERSPTGGLTLRGALFAAQRLAAGTTAFDDLRVRAGDHSYEVVAEGRLGDRSSAVVAATVSPPAPADNVSGELVGPDVRVSWDPPADPHVVGFDVLRDGVLASGAQPETNVAPTASIVRADAGQANPFFVFSALDGNDGTSWSSGFGTTTSVEVDLRFDDPVRITRTRLARALAFTFAFVVEAIGEDGSVDVLLSDDGTGGAALSARQAVPIETRHVRLRLPDQPALFEQGFVIQELQLFSAMPVPASPALDIGVPAAALDYAVVSVDDAGNRSAPSAAASVVAGDIEPPSDLVASVAGERVRLDWTASPSIEVTGYHVYRDGRRRTALPTVDLFYEDAVLFEGSHSYAVTAVDALGHESRAAGPVGVDWTDAGGPAAPGNVQATAVQGGTRVTWAASASPDVAGYLVYLDGSAVPVRAAPASGTSFTAPPQYGRSSYPYLVRAVDLAGNLSDASAVAVADHLAPPQPTNLVANVAGDDVLLTWTNPPALNVYTCPSFRDGVNIGATSTGPDTVTLSSTDPEHQPLLSVAQQAIRDGGADTYWQPAPEDPAPTADLAIGRQVETLTVTWASAELAAASFELEGWDGVGWFALATGAADASLVNTYAFDPHAGTDRVRLRIVAPGPSGTTGLSGVTALRRQTPVCGARLDQSIPEPGEHVWTVAAESTTGQRSVPADPVTATTANVDFVVMPDDIRFSKDPVQLGDAIDITVDVHNAGASDVAAVPVQVWQGSPFAGGLLLAEQVVAVSGFGTVAVTVPFVVDAGDPNIWAVVNPRNEVAEIADFGNNRAVHGLPIRLPYWTQAYFPTGRARVFGYADGTLVRVTSQNDVLQTTRTVDRGQVALLQLGPNDDVHIVSATEPFALLVGQAGNETAFYAQDATGKRASTDLYTMVPACSFAGDCPTNHFIVFACEDGTDAVVEDADSGELLLSQSLDAGEHAIVDEVVERRLHVTANHPVTALTGYAIGYEVPACDTGLGAGRRFYTFAGLSDFDDGQIEDVNVYAYQDNTQVTMRDSVTGALVWADTLDSGEIHSFQQIGQERFYTVESTHDVSMNVRAWDWKGTAAGIDDADFLAGAKGTGVDLDVLGTIVGGRGGKTFLIHGFFDTTHVRVLDLAIDASADGITNNLPGPVGEWAEFDLDARESVDISPARDQGPFSADLAAHLFRVASSRPISAQWFNALGGGETLNFVPVLFGVNAPDLAIEPTDITLSNDLPAEGETIDVTVGPRNLGAQQAEGFAVEVYDGDPAAGGELIFADVVPLLVQGDDYDLTFDYEVRAGLHDLYVVVDGDGIVDEIREDNNVAHRLIPTRPDLRVVSATAPATAAIAASVRVDAIVDNRGGTLAPDARVELWDGEPDNGGTLLAEDRRPLMSGVEVPVSFEWARAEPAGEHALWVVVDSTDQIDESDETNNRASAPLTVEVADLPDLRVRVAELSPADPFTGEPANIMAVLDNAGATTRTGLLAVYDGDPDAGGTLVASSLDDAILEAGVEAAVELAWPAPHTPGPHALFVVADAASEIVEADETNNRAVIQTEVTDSPVTLALVASAPSYLPGETATFTSSLTELAGLDRSGALTVAVLDESDAVVAVVTEGVALDLPAAGSDQRDHDWTVAPLPAGPYRARATWTEAGRPLASADAPFEVTEDAALAARVTTDQLAYGPHETVEATASLDNEGPNRALAGLTVMVEITDPLGVVVATQSVADVALPPGSGTSLGLLWDTGVAAAGQYLVSLTAVDPATGTTVASAATTFELLAGDLAGGVLDGVMSVDPPAVYLPDDVTIAWTLTNVGNTDLSGVTVTTRLVDPVAGAVVSESSSATDIAADASSIGSTVVSTAGLAAGDYVAVVEATSTTGRTLWLGQAALQVLLRTDVDPPVISIDGVADGGFYPATVTPIITVTDASPVATTITLDGLPFASGTPVSAEGTHVLFVQAVDAFDNTATATVTFTIDTIAPVVMVAGVVDGQCGDAATPVVTFADDNLAATTLTLDGQPFVSGTSVVTDGARTLFATATDLAGNTTTRQVTFTVDTIAPVTTVAGVEDGAFYSAAVAATVEIADDNLVAQAVTLDGAQYVPGTLIGTEGGHQLVVTAADCAGHTAEVAVAFTIDLTAPAITIDGVADGQCDGPVTPVVTFADDHLATTSLTLDASPFESGTLVVAEGDHVLAADATDLAENHTARTVAFVIDTTPPDVTIDGVTDGGVYPGPVHPVFTAIDDHLVELLATLDGLPFTSGSEVAAVGVHDLSVTAVDCAGSATVTTVTFEIRPAPASFEIEKSLVAAPGRLLVLVENGRADRAARIDFIEEALAGRDVPYLVVDDWTSFFDELRTGVYTAYMLFGDLALADPRREEIREAVALGDGLVTVAVQQGHQPRLQDVWGADLGGNCHDASRSITIAASDLGADTTLTIVGRSSAERVDETAAAVIGTYQDGRCQDHTALVVSGYGRGRSVLFGFDPSDADQPSRPDALVLVASAIDYATSRQADVLPDAPVWIRTLVTNLDGAVAAARTVESFADVLSVVETDPLANVGPGFVEWIEPYGEHETRTHAYGLSLPDAAGTFTTHTDVLVDDVVVASADLDIVLARSACDLLDDATAALEAIDANGCHDHGGVHPALVHLDGVGLCCDGGCGRDPQDALDDVLLATQKLRTVDCVGTVDARLDLDRLIRVLQVEATP